VRLEAGADYTVLKNAVGDARERETNIAIRLPERALTIVGTTGTVSGRPLVDG
jgi:hypothetical protein